MSKIILATPKGQHQILVRFIQYLSKKDFDNCKSAILGLDPSLANDAKACIQNAQANDCFKEVNKQKQEIKILNDKIHHLQRLKGLKLVGDQNQNNLKLQVLNLVQRGNYEQALGIKLVENQFIHQLIQYERLRRILYQQEQSQVLAFSGSQEFQILKQRLLDSAQQNSAQKNIDETQRLKISLPKIPHFPDIPYPYEIIQAQIILKQGGQKKSGPNDKVQRQINNVVQLHNKLIYLIQSNRPNPINTRTSISQLLKIIQIDIQIVYKQIEEARKQLENWKKQHREKQGLIQELRKDVIAATNGTKEIEQKLKKQSRKYKQLENSQIFEKRQFKQSKIQVTEVLKELQPSPEEKKRITELEEENKLQSQQYQNLRNTYQDKLKQYNSLSGKHEEQSKQLTKISGELAKLKQVEKQNETLKKKLSQQKENFNQQIAQISQLNTIIEELDGEILELQKKLQQREQDNPKEKEVIKQSHKIKQVFQRWQEENKNLKKEYQTIKFECQSQKNKVKQAIKQKEALKKYFQEQVKKRDIQIEKQKKQVKQLKQNKEKTNLIKEKKLKNQEVHRCMTHLFTAREVFENGEQQRLHLIQVLQQEIGAIHQTKLLYSYDPLNRVNFHRYIDNHKNLLVVVKTAIGKLIAAYSESQVSVEGGFRGKGLLMPLWDLKSVFHLIPGKRPVSYDDYYLIFGNSEVRIRSQENKIFSNFGIANAYFDNQRKKIEHLLGQTEREIDLETYQIYKIIFLKDLY